MHPLKAAEKKQPRPLARFPLSRNLPLSREKAAPKRGPSLDQYSLASMMVKTLAVCLGWVPLRKGT
jgi:hypothetical protein